MLITGASRGIGAATARLAAKRGYDVAVNYAGNKGAADAVVADIRKEGRKALAIQADVGKPDEIARLFKTVDAELGAIDAFFNNAGILETASKFVDIAPERLQRIVAVNTVGAFIAAQEAVRRMSTRLGGKGGVIVNMSSLAARLGGTNEATDYAASKGAIDTLTDRPGQGSRDRRHPRPRRAPRPDLYRHPRQHRRSQPRRPPQGPGADAARRHGGGGSRSGAVAVLRPVDLLYRPAARHFGWAWAVTVIPEVAQQPPGPGNKLSRVSCVILGPGYFAGREIPG